LAVSGYIFEKKKETGIILLLKVILTLISNFGSVCIGSVFREKDALKAQ
jgi:hypothetical protein